VAGKTRHAHRNFEPPIAQYEHSDLLRGVRVASLIFWEFENRRRCRNDFGISARAAIFYRHVGLLAENRFAARAVARARQVPDVIPAARERARPREARAKEACPGETRRPELQVRLRFSPGGCR
jgi:hypothetical protein